MPVVPAWRTSSTDLGHVETDGVYANAACCCASVPYGNAKRHARNQKRCAGAMARGGRAGTVLALPLPPPLQLYSFCSQCQAQNPERTSKSVRRVTERLTALGFSIFDPLCVGEIRQDRICPTLPNRLIRLERSNSGACCYPRTGTAGSVQHAAS